MIFVNLLMVAVLGTAMSLSTRFFSPVELQDRFEEGQKLYALGDYNKAIERYQVILSTESNSMINVEEVTVGVDEFILPVRVAATYQLGNTYNKLGLELLQRSQFLRAEQKEEEAQTRYDEALEHLRLSLDYFRQLTENEKVEERTRVMAQYQMIQTNYQLKNFDQVIEEGEKLLRDFPNNIYEASTYYDMAWSYYELEQYQQAIGNFEQVLILAPRGSNADRSLFQIAECYSRLGEREKAMTFLNRLIGRYDFSRMTEAEIIEMTTLKLKGVVKETARELVAKAHLKMGDIYAEAGEVDKALAEYAIIPAEYGAERALVQNSYIQTAELIHKSRGTTAAIAAYKNAIEKVNDKLFQARTQLTVALLLFEEEKYLKAAEEYQIYLDAYGDVAARVGFGRDKTQFRIAQSYQAYGQNMRNQDPEGAAQAVDKALALYGQLLGKVKDDDLLPDVLFGAAFSYQLKEDNDSAKPLYQRLVNDYPDHPATPNGLLQIARIEYEAANYQKAEETYRSFLDKYPASELRNSARMELGLTYKRLKNTDAAIRIYEAVEADWEMWPKVQLDLAEMYVAQGKYDQAEAALREALGKVTDEQLQSQLHYIKARIHFAQDDFPQAIQEWSLALKSPSQDILANALLARGGAYYELAKRQDAAGDSVVARSNYEASITDMKRVLESDPPPYVKDSAFRTLGAGMIRVGLEQEAATYYQQLIGGTDDLQERATFQMLLTELYYDKQDFEQAERFARELLEMDFEDDNTAGYFRKERAYSIIGNALLQQGKPKEAAAIFDQGLKEYPNSGESANLSFSKGFAYFSGGDLEAAVESFKAYLKGFPGDRNSVHGQYYLAHAYQALTQFKDAAGAFAELAKRYPSSGYREESLFLVGENYYNERDFEKAAVAYQEMLKQFPDGEHAPAAQYALAWCYFESEATEKGRAAMEELVARYPRSEFASKAQFTVGDCYYNTRSYEEARAAYEFLIAQYPEADEAPKARGLIAELSEIQATLDYKKVMKLLEDKQYAEAVVGLEEVARKYPGTYTELAAYCNIGLAYEIMRRWPEAAEHYQKVLEKGQDSPESADVVSFAQQHREWIVENRL